MKKLKDLLKDICDVNDDIDIKGVAIDSRLVKEGDLFICLVGSADDGHQHTLEAEMLGAAAIVSEHDVESGLPQFIVKDTREAYALISKRYFNNAVDSLKFIAISGTNGKTSTATILNRILISAGKKTGQIGTLGVRIMDREIESDMTTPDPYNLHRMFSKMKKAGVEYVVGEVTAHAIKLKKLYGTRAELGIFTNLSRDHLDFFCDMQSYGEVKKSYFCKEYMKNAIINADDELGRELIMNNNIPTVSYGIFEPADVFAINVEHTEEGTEFVVNLFDDVFKVKTSLFGLHNVYNILAAATTARLLGISRDIILSTIESMPEIDGRFNIIKHNGGKIIVDFAHTPDGLENLLKAGRLLTSGRLAVVFGCGGNRDRGKRAIMGEVAARNADFVVLTSDNPRYEEPLDIIKDILPAVTERTGNYIILQNRSEAIKYALNNMSEGDTVIVAGKGGEKYTEIKGKKYRSDDLQEIKDYIRSISFG